MLGGLFDHVLVDEYQDVNGLQADAVDLLRPAGTGVTAVGDDAGGRRPVLRTCADQAAEAEAVCDSVFAHREEGVALRDQAVLFRAGHHASTLELALGRRRIPYVKYGGLRFLEAAHVKDLLALLRVLDNPWDELAWSRLLRLLEGVGPATATRVMEQLGVTRPGPGDPGAVTPLARLLAARPRFPSRRGRGRPPCGAPWATAVASAAARFRPRRPRSTGCASGSNP